MQNNADFLKASRLINFSKKKSRCVALIIKPKILSKSIANNLEKKYQKKKILRKDVIVSLLKHVSKNTKIISSVGFNSRELYQIRSEKNYKDGKDFLMVGAMGHTSMLAIAVSKFSKENVICLDGDGSFIMHLGALTMVGNDQRRNFKYILIDNESLESIGNQPLVFKNLNINKLSKAMGFKNYFHTSKIF